MRHDFPATGYKLPLCIWRAQLTQPYTDGEVSYDRHDLKFNLKFSGLAPVQSLRNGVIDRRSHAIGIGTLLLPNDTITGTVYYELMQLEGYNPFANITDGLTYTDYDWLALTSTSGEHLLCSFDSTTSNDRIKKISFLSNRADRCATLTAWTVQIISEGFARDPRTNDLLALKKSIAVLDLGIEAKMTLTNDRIFSTNAYYLSLVNGRYR